MFKIEKTIYEGKQYWTVSRRDGQCFDGPICGYNFELEDWQKAIECRQRLEEN